MKPFLDLPRPWLVAHRGGAALAPENTMAAFDGAVARGADWLELDVRLTRDGALVVFHDPDTLRITGAPGAVESRTFAELQALDAGHGFTPDGGRTFPFRGRGLRVPALTDLLARHPRTRLNIDAKSRDPALAETLAAEVRRAGAERRVCLGSELDAQARRIRRLLPEACHFLPGGAATRHVLAAKLGLGRLLGGGWDCAEIPLRARGMRVATRRVVRHLKSMGMRVLVWTVDDEAEMRALLALDVDGIMTDRPDLLARVLGRA
ncbi:MAG TPA: glycerophosphodiester phosphodiesterase [Anaeromyxobacteraceae bacterium]|jgi:glycerophosphoryl diester phosphodiesterase